jgi:CelD/BcsL family acetyltransferase involved in cellulose biosynthesis
MSDRPSELTLERLDPDRCDWETMDAFPDRQVFQTREWLSFVAETQSAEPVVCALKHGNEAVGYFTGLIVRRYGLRILGSPLPGWTTGYMGFNLEDGVSRRDATAALLSFALGPLRCAHVELRDRYLQVSDADGLSASLGRFTTFEVDLRPDEEEIFARMTSACRRCVRKAEKIGVIVEEAADFEFADDYSAQLEEVFAKQSLRPTYRVDRVRSLIRHLQPTRRLLLLRARSPEGKCIATGIFPAFGRTMYFWGGASWQADQILRPNEAIFWYAMGYWKRRGIEAFDLGGGGEYKRKYGGEALVLPHFMRSRYPVLGAMREVVRQLHDPDGIRSRVARIARRPSS